MSNKINEVKKISISAYLSNLGVETDKNKNSNAKTWFSSPFTSDSSPSFCVYEDTNTYFDWSSGKGGDIINLVSNINNGCNVNEAIKIITEGALLPISFNKRIKKEVDNSKFKGFNYKKFLTRTKKSVSLIDEYAKSRGLIDNYLPGIVPIQIKKDTYSSKECMIFVHRDEDLDICGIRARYIDNKLKQRFNSRGRLCYFILENIISYDTTVYLTESETSSISLFYLLKECNKSFIILCFGGVNNAPIKIPDSMSDFEIKVIIDYDGDEDKYNKRIEPYLKFGNDIKIPLDKGEDINSLYTKGRKKELLNYLL